MKNIPFCQSCSMPLDSDDVLGTEKDGSKNHEYCHYCFKDGEFVNPALMLNEMRELVKSHMETANISRDIINQAVNRLPGLKRWKKEKPVIPYNKSLRGIIFCV